MLLKVDAIKEIGRFASLKQKAPQFTQLTLIFARNGYGKSTLCSILRSAADGEASHISARRRLGAKADSTVQIQWQAGGVVTFSNGCWNLCPGPVHIFDSEYVRQNLHVAESVTRDNKRTVLRVVLGAAGVTLADAVERLDAEQRTLTDRQRTVEKAIQAAFPVIIDVKKYCTIDVPVDIDAQITAAGRQVELTRQAMTVKQKKAPVGVELDGLAGIEEVLGRTIADVSEHAVTMVKKHVEAHGMEQTGERWIKYGVDHLHDDQCPFCEQSVKGVEIVSAFEAYFSEEFNRLTTDRDAYLERLLGALGADVAAMDQLVEQNDVDFIFWDKVCDIDQAPTMSPDERSAVNDGLSKLLNAMNQKVANPLSVIVLGEERAGIEAAYKRVNEYNEAVVEAVKAVNDAKAAVDAIDAKEVEDVLKRKIALKGKLTDPVKAFADEYAKNHLRLSAINDEKKKAQKALKEHVEGALKDRETRINELLDQFGANFHIGRSKANFTGREGNVDYCIVIGQSAVPVGDSSKDQPSFKTVLSGGDKFTLALAFFITEVTSDPHLGQATVALDDPFSSQDMQRQFETASQIWGLARAACQVIVFSHDPRFLAQIEKDADKDTCSTFQINCTDEGDGSIERWSSEEELKTEYVRQAEVIREFAHTGKFLTGADGSSVIKDLRPFAEGYLKARFPGRFGPLEFLYPMTEAIEKAGSDDPCFSMIGDLRAINDYSKANHHADGAKPDPTGLRTQCKRLIKIVGAY